MERNGDMRQGTKKVGTLDTQDIALVGDGLID
jgi:hypothetical protein